MDKKELNELFNEFVLPLDKEKIIYHSSPYVMAKSVLDAFLVWLDDEKRLTPRALDGASRAEN